MGPSAAPASRRRASLPRPRPQPPPQRPAAAGRATACAAACARPWPEWPRGRLRPRGAPNPRRGRRSSPIQPLWLHPERSGGRTAFPDITLLRSGRRRRRRVRTTLLALLTHLGAAGLHGGAALLNRQHAVAVRIHSREGLGRLALGLGDDDGEAALGALRSHTAAPIPSTLAPMSAPHARAVVTAPAHTVAAGLRRLELGAAEGAVLVGVQPVEPGRKAFGAARLAVGAHLLGRHLTVAVRVRRAQALDPALHEIGLADRLG